MLPPVGVLGGELCVEGAAGEASCETLAARSGDPREGEGGLWSSGAAVGLGERVVRREACDVASPSSVAPWAEAKDTTRAPRPIVRSLILVIKKTIVRILRFAFYRLAGSVSIHPFFCTTQIHASSTLFSVFEDRP